MATTKTLTELEILEQLQHDTGLKGEGLIAEYVRRKEEKELLLTKESTTSYPYNPELYELATFNQGGRSE